MSPYFRLDDVQTTQVLVSQADQYINLYNAVYDYSASSRETEKHKSTEPLDISTKLASYKLIDEMTEAVIAPSSLTYTTSGTHFLAGSKNQISLFDLTNTYKPVTKIRTIPSARSKDRKSTRLNSSHWE